MADSEILDWESGSWVPGPDLPYQLYGGGVVSLDEEGTKHLLVAGNTVLNPIWAMQMTYTYDWSDDEATRQWREAGNIPDESRREHVRYCRNCLQNFFLRPEDIIARKYNWRRKTTYFGTTLPRGASSVAIRREKKYPCYLTE